MDFGTLEIFHAASAGADGVSQEVIAKGAKSFQVGQVEDERLKPPSRKPSGLSIATYCFL